MLFGHVFMRTCGICAPPHLLSQFLGPTPVLPVGGGVGGEAGGVEEDTEVGVKASAHLSLLFLGSLTLPLRDTTIQPRVGTLGTLCLGLLIGLPLFHQEANSNTSVMFARARAHVQTWSRPDPNIYWFSCSKKFRQLLID